MINLKYNDGYAWLSEDNAYVKGYFYKGLDNLPLHQVLTEVKELDTPYHFMTFLKKQVGNFAIVSETKDYVFAAVDFVRSIPLFYRMDGKEFFLSDDPDVLLKGMKRPRINPLSVSEFQLTTYVVGNSTLYQEIGQIDSGEFLVFDKKSKKLNISEYRRFDLEPTEIEDTDEAIEKIHGLYRQAVQRIVNSIDGRPIIIPLSGGEDSRIVISLLHELKYPKVICFTYGIRDSQEAQVSKKVAEYYGYPWHCVEYNQEKWRQFFQSDEYLRISQYHSRYVSTPHLQDFIAVRELREQGILPQNGVVVPGHTGDFIMGNLVPKIFVLSVDFQKSNVLEEIINRYYSNFAWSRDDLERRDTLLDHLDKTIGHAKSGKANELLLYYDRFGWKEYHAKLIINSIRTYEYFEFQWRMPLWDLDVVDFWRKVPNHLRYARNLHYTYACKKQADLRKYLKLPDTHTMKLPTSLGRKGVLRLRFPRLFTYLRFKQTNKNVRATKSKHEYGWFDVLTEKEFQAIAHKVTGINSIISYDYLNRFLKK